jgi:hypothetical protein
MARYVDMMLPCKLTEGEVQEKIRKLVSFKQDFRQVLLDEARFKAEIKRRKEEVEPTINSLEKEIVEESEQRRVKCQMVYDSEDMTVSTVRTDTWEQVGKSRAMTQEEIDQHVKIDLVREAEKAQAGESKAPEGERAEDIAADGAEPADIEGGQDAEEEAQSLPVNGDPDGWLEPAEGAQEASQASEGEAPTQAGEEAAQAPQEGQEGPSQADLDEWGNVEFPEGRAAAEGSQEKVG